MVRGLLTSARSKGAGSGDPCPSSQERSLERRRGRRAALLWLAIGLALLTLGAEGGIFLALYVAYLFALWLRASEEAVAATL